MLTRLFHEIVGMKKKFSPPSRFQLPKISESIWKKVKKSSKLLHE